MADKDDGIEGKINVNLKKLRNVGSWLLFPTVRLFYEVFKMDDEPGPGYITDPHHGGFGAAFIITAVAHLLLMMGGRYAVTEMDRAIHSQQSFSETVKTVRYVPPIRENMPALQAFSEMWIVPAFSAAYLFATSEPALSIDDGQQTYVIVGKDILQFDSTKGYSLHEENIKDTFFTDWHGVITYDPKRDSINSVKLNELETQLNKIQGVPGFGFERRQLDIERNNIPPTWQNMKNLLKTTHNKLDRDYQKARR